MIVSPTLRRESISLAIVDEAKKLANIREGVVGIRSNMPLSVRVLCDVSDLPISCVDLERSVGLIDPVETKAHRHARTLPGALS